MRGLLQSQPRMTASVSLLYRDDHVLLVDKPAGMIVHRGWADDPETLLRAARTLAKQRVFPIHRLDRGASGVVLFALDRASAGVLGRAFAESRVRKRYLALTRGHPPERGLVDHPLQPATGGERVAALTEYVRLGTSGRYALVECNPRTGRLHQIRRHMKHLSCPLIGDVRYGKGEHNRLFRERYGLHRLALHASWLGFEHPHSGLPMVVSAPLSGALRDCLESIGLLRHAEQPRENA